MIYEFFILSEVGEFKISKSALFFFCFYFFTVLLGENIDILVGLNAPGIGLIPFQSEPALGLLGLKAYDFLYGLMAGELKNVSVRCFPLSKSDSYVNQLALVLNE